MTPTGSPGGISKCSWKSHPVHYIKMVEACNGDLAVVVVTEGQGWEIEEADVLFESDCVSSGDERKKILDLQWQIQKDIREEKW